jgi:hypothetical protein
MIYGQPKFNETLLKLLADPKKKNCPMYDESCKHADEMSVHMYGKKPVEVLNRVRPREDPAVKQYRLDSWEPFTKSTADKALVIVNKMSNPTLYSIRWDKTSAQIEELKKWTMEEYPVNNSVVGYFFGVGMRKMIADPNGVFAIKPMENPSTDTERVKPIIKCYGSKVIWSLDSEHCLIFIKEELVNGLKHYFFEYYDKNAVILLEVYTANLKDVTVNEVEVYEHNFGEIPVWKMGGNIEVDDAGKEMFKSFFEPAVPFWNKAINHESDLEGAYIQHMHPLRVEASVECDYIHDNQRCKQGYITNSETGARTMCPSCGGSGVRGMLNSPFGVIRVNAEMFRNEPGNSSIAPVSFVTVPTEATAMLEARVDKLLERGLYALNMDVVNKVGENQSGRAKVIDRGELYEFLFKIATQVFDTHLPNIFYFMNMYMFRVEASSKGQQVDSLEDNLPEVNKPTQFDISTAEELLLEFDTAKKSGASPSYLKNKQKQLNAKEFSTDTSLRDKMNLILDCDPIADASIDDLIAQSDKGWFESRDLVIHANINKFVERAMLEYKDFANLPADKRYEILKGYAEEVEEENREKLEEQPSSPE